ncbi:MAG: phytanoyl-CoA dioxygenase family protein [Myxococcota bacterium]|jgi:ectoine hydroxylase-related dioxygenase (phytanoyl-CoA dioxygenase family)|nr:phytanoyl-CoA dioxygenase [Deltaproteobacteria bacterium]MCP4245317.1 phytanoyl-CoA dioxygenase [bacterium]MDP6242253.1 phytanoyl-CoA dioxygenase family protein [Myxococcota bacterium]MDP7074412.1 phytanoyl-CoA dioxygenase family protein [Myxococcota bacterium]MDP7300566.1 phytanoyl-CoA dioxygenase family protein [Myxococcota bacterium]
MPDSQVQRQLEAIERDGYTIVEDVLEPDSVEAIGKRVREIEKQTLGETERGRPIDGNSQLRTAGLLRLDPLFWEIPVLEGLLPVVQGILGAECLLTAFSAIDLLPGENRQPIHPDDALIPLPRPHQPVVCTCMVAIDAFTSENGATRLLPGSHKTAGVPDYGTDHREVEGMIAAEMRAGSAVVFNGALLHQAADNESDAPRLGLQVSYCAPWIRPFTNFFLSIPEEEVARYPKPLVDLLGYKDFDGIGSTKKGPAVTSYRESYGQLYKRRAERLRNA